MKKTLYSKLLNLFIIVGSVLALIALLAMPFMLSIYFNSHNIEIATNAPYVLSGGLDILAIPFFIALFQLKKIMKTLYGSEVFTNNISKAFSIVAVCAFVKAVLFVLVNFLMYLTLEISSVIICVACPFVAVTAGLLCMCMSVVFDKATKLKEENDLIF